MAVDPCDFPICPFCDGGFFLEDMTDEERESLEADKGMFHCDNCDMDFHWEKEYRPPLFHCRTITDERSE